MPERIKLRSEYETSTAQLARNLRDLGPVFAEAAERLEELEAANDKLREEQRSALAHDEFRDLPTHIAPSPSVVCVEGDHETCLLPSCTCECHTEEEK